MTSILLSILLSIIHTSPQQFTQKKIDVDFQFKSMTLGKPTLSWYNYDITIKNNEDRTWYVAIPRWFNEQIERKSAVTGAHYDTFGEVKGITLYCATTITIFQVQPGQQIKITDFRIETFDEKIPDKTSTNLEYAVFNRISISDMTLPDFMAKEDWQDDNLEYLMTEAYSETVEIKVKK